MVSAEVKLMYSLSSLPPFPLHTRCELVCSGEGTRLDCTKEASKWKVVLYIQSHGSQ